MSMNSQAAVVRMACSLDVVAAQEHMRKTRATVRRRALRDNGRMYSVDETALIALHKMRSQIGSRAEIEASKNWLRALKSTSSERLRNRFVTSANRFPDRTDRSVHALVTRFHSVVPSGKGTTDMAVEAAT